jgi:hypothetical protein
LTNCLETSTDTFLLSSQHCHALLLYNRTTETLTSLKTPTGDPHHFGLKSLTSSLVLLKDTHWLSLIDLDNRRSYKLFPTKPMSSDLIKDFFLDVSVGGGNVSGTADKNADTSIENTDNSVETANTSIENVASADVVEIVSLE